MKPLAGSGSSKMHPGKGQMPLKLSCQHLPPLVQFTSVPTSPVLPLLVPLPVVAIQRRPRTGAVTRLPYRQDLLAVTTQIRKIKSDGPHLGDTPLVPPFGEGAQAGPAISKGQAASQQHRSFVGETSSILNCSPSSST